MTTRSDQSHCLHSFNPERTLVKTSINVSVCLLEKSEDEISGAESRSGSPIAAGGGIYRLGLAFNWPSSSKPATNNTSCSTAPPRGQKGRGTSSRVSAVATLGNRYVYQGHSHDSLLRSSHHHYHHNNPQHNLPSAWPSTIPPSRGRR